MLFLYLTCAMTDIYFMVVISHRELDHHRSGPRLKAFHTSNCFSQR